MKEDGNSHRWVCLEKRLLQQMPRFTLWEKRMLLPRNSYEDNFYSLESFDWVNIVAVTPAGEVVMVRQFRQGIMAPSLELPGGVLDSASEEPKLAALRELEEETGYAAREARSLGCFHPNPGLLNNRCHTFLAEGLSYSGKQDLEPAEDITVHLIPLADIPGLILGHEIMSALVIAAFSRYFFSAVT